MHPIDTVLHELQHLDRQRSRLPRAMKAKQPPPAQQSYRQQTAFKCS
jgi:hypothetical protein